MKDRADDTESMEEILASIRRIVTADSDKPCQVKGRDCTTEGPSPIDDDVLLSTEVVERDRRIAAKDDAAIESSDSAQSGRLSPSSPHRVDEDRGEARPNPSAQSSDAVNREDVASATSQAVSRLAGTMAGREGSENSSSQLRSAMTADMTIEELVGSSLRPMLKAWLDENLPDLVERLVRQEIKKVIRDKAD
ncbi:MAG: DUF2497 domain-containing protein [Alphaproteobacteria bacterium]|nr:DUF2497 domain-containing protein [Alphaproteobacteria bacterium]